MTEIYIKRHIVIREYHWDYELLVQAMFVSRVSGQNDIHARALDKDSEARLYVNKGLRNVCRFCNELTGRTKIKVVNLPKITSNEFSLQTLAKLFKRVQLSYPCKASQLN